MAAITRPTKIPSIGSLALPHNCRLSGLICGEDIDPFMPCYIKAADGKVYKAQATNDEKQYVRGFAGSKCLVAQNDAVTLVHSTEVPWANATPGANFFLSASVAGGLDTVTSTYAPNALGFFKDVNHAFIYQPR